MDRVDCVVIGGGVVGLAITKKICESGLSCVVVDSTKSYGQGISSRNSEVIHAGIYYPNDSLKAKFCLRGKHLLYEYCKSRNISHHKCGKIIVATSPEDEDKLSDIFNLALANGVNDLSLISKKNLIKLEPLINGYSGLLSPSTGIIDSHEYMTNLLSDIESLGGNFVPNSPVNYITRNNSGYKVSFNNDKNKYSLNAKFVVNSGGLSAQNIANNIEDFPKDLIPDLYLCKGTYFSLSGEKPFTHLVYPVPPKRGDGLGIHSTIDMSGVVKFGPDIEYVDYEDYSVDESKVDEFFEAISNYFPSINKSKLKPDYCGLRPKLQGPKDSPKDFIIQDYSDDGFSGLIQLFGIESPGLTSSLAIAEHVDNLISMSN
tara:strand:- start:407 stop:1525 length:1119 start_codon:yes stop_codon:yes gene_type:complete